MYSLTKATEDLINHYNIWNINIEKKVSKYNNHKLRHSNWVLEIWRLILIKMEENKKINDIIKNKLEIVFLLHDVWRFYQNNKERVLAWNEFEHWNFWYNLLQKDWYDEQICLAVKYHNKYNINDLYNENTFKKMNNDEKNNTLFISKIIRDADKVQNMLYNIFNSDTLSKLDWDKIDWWDISDKIFYEFKKEKLVDRWFVVSKADFIVSLLCWTFDINFKESINVLNMFWYHDKILKELYKINWIDKNKLDILKNVIYNYINKL